jgi:hypothetical protein
MIGEGHTCDIWKPTMTLGDQNKVLTTPYTKIKSNAVCRFHEVNARIRMELGIAVDATADMQAVVFRGAAITDLGHYYILHWNEEGTNWLVNLPPQHNTLPKEYWKAYLEILRGSPVAHRDAYES